MKIFILLFILSVSIEGEIQAQRNTDTTVSFKVSGNCAMCKSRIETEVKNNGAKSADWNSESQMLKVNFNPLKTTKEKLQQKIAAVGHDAEPYLAPDEVYNTLPDCCLYRDAEKMAEHNSAHHLKKVMGVIMEENNNGLFKPLSGASIILKGSNAGVITKNNGFFSLSTEKEKAVITVSYVGFQPKDIEVKPGDHLTISLNISKALEGIKIISLKRATYVSPLSAIRTQVMTQRELSKAACCNLSESFETNPSVDVSFNDAITGSKQVQLLGLSGNYTQLTVENLPGPRGIATPLGLNSIPGTWVESIQLSKGVGSVANGFESIAGQINVELIKPENSDLLYANAYINNMGKTDLNLNLSKKINNKWSTALLLHNAFLANNNIDFNKDGFRDSPTGNLFSALNRWQYFGTKGVEGQFGIRILTDKKTGGLTTFNPDNDKLTTNKYGLGFGINRYEIFSKIGYVFPGKNYKSVGLQLSAFHHSQDSYFGTTVYDATQNNFYANLIYQSIISNTNHKFRTGISIVGDKYDELFRATTFKRKETVAGAFFEYTFTSKENFNLILGGRADHNSIYGFFITPRLHVRYEPIRGTIIRLAGGRGQRTANIFAENSGVFASSRIMNILNITSGKAYGLNQEIAWNEGISVDQKFRFLNRNGSLGIDFFRTDFINQVVADVDNSARQINFYNLDGKSFSNSFQAELNYEIFWKFDLRIAYRLFDVKTTYHDELLQKPLLSKHRGFVNLAYETGKWKFDYTINFNSSKRLPYSGDNPVQYRWETSSPSYVLMNAQVSKSFGKKLPVEVYLGSENITNYFQEKAIISADQPFGQHFDASIIWAPVTGRMIYTGIRFKIQAKE
ncbi:MAG: carboxypeptidase-like regulatory domain-containing protein [Chitinophagaceae bacterium]